MGRHPNHYSTNPGKRVLIKFKNGEEVLSKFVKKEGKFLYLETGIYPWKKIKAFIVYKKAPI